ncbi:MAG: hypothetical protein COB66_08335 [Coxiella sp. (in: Bacteria)]|nr:MAG: hypothetical protein COB66_08335 [Coxiella sp. (in: g-proteobacteria)]
MTPLTVHWAITIVAFAFVMVITPGPNNILLASSGAIRGFKKTLPLLASIGLGALIILIVLAVGGVILLNYAVIRDGLRIVCLLYIVYLAYKIATSGAPRNKTAAPALSFWKIIALQWLNPKVWIQYIVVLSLYTNAQHQYPMQVFFIAIIFIGISIIAGFTWILLGKVIARYLTKPGHYHMFNIAMAVLLLLAVIPALFEHYI